MEEITLQRITPSTWRSQPVYFLFLVVMTIAGIGLSGWFHKPWFFLFSVLGISLYLMWWITQQFVVLTITNKRVSLRKGILSRYTNEITHFNIKNIEINQNFLQLIFGVGKIGIASAGQGVIEIEVDGIPDPEGVRQLINKAVEDLQKESQISSIDD